MQLRLFPNVVNMFKHYPTIRALRYTTTTPFLAVGLKEFFFPNLDSAGAATRSSL
jgi:hypothetical protein